MYTIPVAYRIARSYGDVYYVVASCWSKIWRGRQNGGAIRQSNEKVFRRQAIYYFVVLPKP